MPCCPNCDTRYDSIDKMELCCLTLDDTHASDAAAFECECLLVDEEGD